MIYDELKTALEKISKNKGLIEKFRNEVKNKTMELLSKQGYKKSEEEFAQDASELIENLNIDEEVLKLVSGGNNEKLDKFKKAGIVALAGLSLGTSVSPELYAGNVIPNQSVKQKQEIQNKKSNWIDFSQLITCLLVGGATFGVGEHLVVKPLINKFRKKDPTNSNHQNNGQNIVYVDKTIEKEVVKEFSKFKTEEDVINGIFDHIKKFGDFEPINDYFDILKNFGLELCKHRSKFAEKDKTTIQELLDDKDIEPHLKAVFNAVVNLNNTFGKIGLEIADDATTYDKLVAKLKDKQLDINSNSKVLRILETIIYSMWLNFRGKISAIHDALHGMMNLSSDFMNNHIICCNWGGIKSDFDVIFNDIEQYLDNNLNDFLVDEKTKSVRESLYNFLDKYFEDEYEDEYEDKYTNIGDLKTALQSGKVDSNDDEEGNKTTLRKYLLEKIDYNQIKIKEQYEDIEKNIVENLIRSRIEKKEAEK